MEVLLFFQSSIESITITSNVVKLDDCFCNCCFHLNEKELINVIENNPKFKSINDKIIIGKSNLALKDYGDFIFACINIEKAIIPSLIKCLLIKFY